MSATRTLPRGLVGAAALALAAALGACGSPRASVADTAARPAVASAAKPSAAKPSAAKTPAANTPAASAPTRACTTADLALAPAQRRVTNGVQVERFALTAVAPTGCVLDGVPNLVPRGPLSPQVPGATVDLALSQQGFPDDLDITPPRRRAIPLLPGEAASFYLAWFSASPVVCVPSNGFGLNAPGDTSYPDMRVVNYPIGPICDGVFYVSAVF